jgi:hypothetical protein
LKAYAVKEYLETLDQKRDEILSGYGVPPSKVGVIESGNLGGGTGTSQDKTFRVNTCGPTAEAVLEKLVFHLLREAFGISDEWTLRFGDIDWRDDKTVDDISSQRLRDGRWTLNRSRAEIGEPPVDGGDSPVIIDRANLVLWSDLQEFSRAQIDKNEQGAIAAGLVLPAGRSPQTPDVPTAYVAPTETSLPHARELRESWQESYARHLVRVRAELDRRER